MASVYEFFDWGKWLHLYRMILNQNVDLFSRSANQENRTISLQTDLDMIHHILGQVTWQFKKKQKKKNKFA